LNQLGQGPHKGGKDHDCGNVWPCPQCIDSPRKSEIGKREQAFLEWIEPKQHARKMSTDEWKMALTPKKALNVTVPEEKEGYDDILAYKEETKEKTEEESYVFVGEKIIYPSSPLLVDALGAFAGEVGDETGQTGSFDSGATTSINDAGGSSSSEEDSGDDHGDDAIESMKRRTERAARREERRRRREARALRRLERARERGEVEAARKLEEAVKSLTGPKHTQFRHINHTLSPSSAMSPSSASYLSPRHGGGAVHIRYKRNMSPSPLILNKANSPS
jgi:hypothetical protein